MAIDFPASPTDGQVFNVSPGNSFVARGGVWRPAPLKTALPKNYIINPAMQVSQQNGTTDSPTATSGSYYSVDQWLTRWSTTSGGATLYANNFGANLSPLNNNAMYLQTVTPQATIGTNEGCAIEQFLEGQRVADFQWGTANAKQVVLRFSVLAGLSGTSAFSINTYPISPTSLNSYVGTYAVSPTAWVDVVVAIPGPTGNAPATDTAKAVGIAFAPAYGNAGSLGAGALNQWTSQLSAKYGAQGQTNMLSVAGSFIVADVGLYLDPYQTGLPPPFELPFIADELRRCQRYWYRSYSARGETASTVAVNQLGAVHPVPMRIYPAVAKVGTPLAYDGSVTPAITAVNSSPSNTMYLEANCAVAAVTAQRPGGHIWNADTNYLAVDARM